MGLFKEMLDINYPTRSEAQKMKSKNFGIVVTIKGIKLDVEASVYDLTEISINKVSLPGSTIDIYDLVSSDVITEIENIIENRRQKNDL